MTGIIELVIMLVVFGIIFPMVTFGFTSLMGDSATITAKSVATGTLAATISATVQQLSGAEPEPYCPDAYGAATDKTLIFTTPLSTCPGPTQGPPATSTGNPPVLLPTSTAKASCEPHGAITPHGSQAALLIATPSCVGFLGYDYEAGATRTTPLTFPYETLLWVAPSSGEVTLTEYPKLGTWNGTSCVAGTATYTNGCWLAKGAQTRALGTISGGDAMFTYSDATGTIVSPYGADGVCTGAQSPSKEGRCADALAAITTVHVKAKFSEGRATSVTSTFSVPLYGSIDSSRSGLGTAT